MADQEVKLIGVWGSPFSRRVEIALKLKGIKYEFLEEDLSNKSPLLLKYNPIHKKVPVLLHNRNPIAESLVIVEYIDETWKSGPLILPTDPYGRAMARFWAKFIDDKCLPAIWKIRRSQGEERKQAIDEAFEHLKILENELHGKKFFGGENVGFVDIAANFIGLWLGIVQELLGIELLTKEKLPKLCEWVDNYLNSAASGVPYYYPSMGQPAPPGVMIGRPAVDPATGVYAPPSQAWQSVWQTADDGSYGSGGGSSGQQGNLDG